MNQLRVLPCSTCNNTVELNSVKYYTADQQHVFCDAYCSNKWYDIYFKAQEKKKNDEQK